MFSSRAIALGTLLTAVPASIATAGYTFGNQDYSAVVTLTVDFVGPVVLDLDLVSQDGVFTVTGTSTAVAFNSTGPFTGGLDAFSGLLSGLSVFPVGPGTSLQFDTNIVLSLTSNSGGTAAGTLYGYDPFAGQFVTANAVGSFTLTPVPAPGALALLSAAGLVSRRRRR